MFSHIRFGLLWIIKQQESIAGILPALCRTDDGQNGNERDSYRLPFNEKMKKTRFNINEKATIELVGPENVE